VDWNQRTICYSRKKPKSRGGIGIKQALIRFAQQALGHNSMAVHHAYLKRAEVTVPALDDWEKGWNEKLKPEMPRPAVVQVDFLGQGERRLAYSER
jgi:hypothetical protein